MAKLNTTVPVLYCTRDNKTAVIITEMIVTENGDGFTVDINDYADNDGVVMHIKRKSFFKTAEEINGLYDMVSPMVDQTLPYSEKQIQTKEFAFLVYVQNDFIKDAAGNTIEGKTIYNLNPDQWEIKR